MPNPNDPWNLSFSTMKTAYKANMDDRQAGFRPGFSIFNVSELITFLNQIQNEIRATHVVFYAVEDPDSLRTERRFTVGVPIVVDANGTPTRFLVSPEYAVALHNCPPDCYEPSPTPGVNLDKISLEKEGSIV